MHYVYVLQSEKNGRFYVGYAGDVERRVEEHNRGKVRATRYLRPLEVVYSEEYVTASEARQREQEIKAKKSRKYIEGLISGREGL